MTKRLLLLFFTFLLVLPSGAWPSRADAAWEQRFAHGLLWKVERPGVPPSHVFGTCHSSDPQILAVADAIGETFEGAANASFEILLTPAAEAELLVAMLATPETSAKKLLTPELFARAVERANRYFPHPERIAGLKLWAVAMLLSFPPPEVRSDDPILDDLLQTRAEEAGKPTYGLETVQEQASALESLPYRLYVQMLEEVLAGELDDFEEATDTLYLARDLAGMLVEWEALLASLDPADAQVLQNRLIDDRNRLMVERMAPRLDEGNAFIAIGALHLPGDNGILQLLAEQGYSVTPVY